MTNVSVPAVPDDASRGEVVFGSAAETECSLVVRQLRGREAISQPFEFELQVESVGEAPLSDAEIDALMSRPAYFAFGRDHEHKTWGVLKSLELVSQTDAHHALYSLVLVPRLHYLALSSGSRVFLDASVPQIVENVVRRAGLAEPPPGAPRGDQAGSGFVSQCGPHHDPREYSLQYQETDLAFVSRLMESAGIAYHFRHGDNTDQMVLSDANWSFPVLEGHETLEYHAGETGSVAADAVVAFARLRQLTSRQVRVRDYNYRMPGVRLDVTRPVDANARGELVYFGEDVESPADAGRVAMLRAELELARKWVCRGRTHIQGLRAGRRFTLRGHFQHALDQEYLITEVRHVADQRVGGEDAPVAHGYTNEFTAVPAGLPFRPALATPRPRIAGVIAGVIDGPPNVATPPIDALGRYRVKLMVDPYAVDGGNASCWIRMAQMLASTSQGSHFPVEVGTEVLIVHHDGDPDRPVIVATAPTATAVSPVVRDNANQSVLRTRKQIEIRFDDEA